MTTFFRRNLPHYHLPNATYFITIRLAGSLPRAVAMRLEEEYEAEQRRLAGQLGGDALREARYEARKRHFARVDSLLDQARHGPRWLAQPECAAIVAQTVHALAPTHYHLHAFCLMSNHAHLLFDQQGVPEPPPRRNGKRYIALSRALRLLKGQSGTLCNRALGREGGLLAARELRPRGARRA